MPLSSELSELVARLEKVAMLARSEPMRALERSVCGCDYGSTGGTTRAEAERIAALLELRPGTKLLELGAGSGWPGIYLAKITGCDVVMVDLPFGALRIARERADEDGLGQQCRVVVADGTALPFGEASFDALSHSDLLCCTPDKLGVLRACRRVARGQSKMAFTVILLAPSLTDSERQITLAAAPKFVQSDSDYAVLLEQSGWWLSDRIDVTAAHLQTMRADVEGTRERAGELAQVFGANELGERIKRGQAQVDALAAGSMRRELLVAQACP
jgi:SAM-dependent methyltransferase